MKDGHKRALKAGPGNGAKLQIVERLQRMGHHRSLYEVYCDFVAAAAIAISNRVDLIRSAERELEYERITKRYSKQEITLFSESLALLRLSYGDPGHPTPTNFDDVLGEIFMSLEFGNDAVGQFFTPSTICRLTSQLTFDERGVRAAIAERGYVSAMDPAVGAGAMLIAFAQILAERGIDYQKHLVVTGVDISLVAVQMAYLQCSLLDIPAVIVHGNSLTLQEHSAWLTPAYVRNGFATRDVIAGRSRYLVDRAMERPADTGLSHPGGEPVNSASHEESAVIATCDDSGSPDSVTERQAA